MGDIERIDETHRRSVVGTSRIFECVGSAFM